MRTIQIKISIKLVFLTLLSIITSLYPLYCAGTSSANFLKISPGAKPSGIGEAFTSIADDASAIYWNTAGLANLKSRELVLSHNIWFEDIQHSFAAVAIPINSVKRRVLGISATYLSITGLDRRVSNTANPEGSFGASDFSFSVAYAVNTQKILFLPFSYGVSLKFIRQSIDQYSADAFASDLGAIAQLQISGIPARFGVCIQNIGTSLQFKNEEYQLPLIYKFGISAKPFDSGKSPILVALDVDFPNDSDINVKFGFEFALNSMLNLRAGYTNMNSSTRDAINGGRLGTVNNSQLSAFTGLTAGFGLNIPLNMIKNLSNGLNLDYAFVPYGELGNTHRISLGMKW